MRQRVRPESDASEAIRTRRLATAIQRDFSRSIKSTTQWSRLTYRLPTGTTARTETVKWAIDRRDADRVYFINSWRWQIHAQFIHLFIDAEIDPLAFGDDSYVDPDRRFVLGSLLHYADSDLWTFEMDASDTMEPDGVLSAFRLIGGRLFFGDDMRYRPRSEHHERVRADLAAALPSIPSSAVHANIAYQPLVLGTAIGYLRLHRGRLDVSALSPTDIVVTDTVPDEIPPVAALITGELQAPLAHVAVLCRNRSTPDMALRAGHDDPRLRELEGELVELTVGSQDFAVQRASMEQARIAWGASRPTPPRVPPPDLSQRQLVDLSALPIDSARWSGAKADRLARLSRIPDIETPGGFVIPISAYNGHLARTGIGERLSVLLQREDFRTVLSVRSLELQAVRAAIENAPLDADLARSIMDRLGDGSRSFIFRSSTNAEDLDGFNGAGLYESVVVRAPITIESMSTRLRRVWSSVWLQRAYEERDWYGIDHREVGMAVLAQPFLDDVAGTGVAITGNPFNENMPGMLINVQSGSRTVTGACGNEIPEQFLVSTVGDHPEIELLNRSSADDGAPIMNDFDVLALVRALNVAHAATVDANVVSDPSRQADHEVSVADVEFALTRSDRRVIILQTRPYLIQYNAERSVDWEDHRRFFDRALQAARPRAHRWMTTRRVTRAR